MDSNPDPFEAAARFRGVQPRKAEAEFRPISGRVHLFNLRTDIQASGNYYSVRQEGIQGGPCAAFRP
jgi:hypothetical protein